MPTSMKKVLLTVLNNKLSCESLRSHLFLTETADSHAVPTRAKK